MNFEDSTPIAILTVADLKEIINNSKPQESQYKPEEKRYVYGLKGIEELFNCSHLTAQRYKDGIIKGACMQSGRKIIVDVDLALELFNKNKRYGRK